MTFVRTLLVPVFRSSSLTGHFFRHLQLLQLLPRASPTRSPACWDPIPRRSRLLGRASRRPAPRAPGSAPRGTHQSPSGHRRNRLARDGEPRDGAEARPPLFPCSRPRPASLRARVCRPPARPFCLPAKGPAHEAHVGATWRDRPAGPAGHAARQSIPYPR